MPVSYALPKYGYTYPFTLTAAHIFEADAILNASTYVFLGDYTVSAGEQIAVGYGGYGSQEGSIGRAYAKFIDDTAGDATEETGTIRLSIWDAQNNPLRVLFTLRTNSLNTSATDRTQQYPLPFSNVWVSQDKKLVLEFLGDAADTIQYDFSVIYIDCTRRIVNYGW